MRHLAIDTEKMKELQRADSDRFIRLLPPATDPLVVVLKGHLLIEEQLSQILRVGLADPEAVSEIRLTFAQKLGLARGIAGRFLAEDIHEATKRLNRIRNTLAHEAEPNGLEDLVGRYLDWCQQLESFSRVLSPEPHVTQLHDVVATCWGHLSGVKNALTVVERLVGRPQAVNLEDK